MESKRRSLPSPHLLASALALAVLPSAAFANDAGGTGQATDLDAVVVTASPLKGNAESVATPVEVLYGEDLDKAKSGTLGETVAKLPGVQTTYFGTGVGRPIIRGQEGPRVQVLSGGIGSMDASTVSADHAVSIEPFLADQIEVLKGPATLLFGSGAIGGAVNVVDGRLADTIPDEPLSGRAEIRGNTVNDERTGMFRLDGVNGNWVLHVDGLVRDTDDYDIPGVAILHDHEEGEEHEEEPQPEGTLLNSSVKTRAGAIGATWLGEGGYFGLAGSTYRSNYGIPAGAHVHGVEDHDHDHDGEADRDEEAHEEGAVRIDMVQNRVDLKTGIYNPVSFLQSVNLRAAWNDYEHVELEGGLPATRFTNEGYDARLEAVQKDWNGWRGAFGLQFGSTDFGAVGEEAFVPSTTTDNVGAFIVQEKDFGPWKLELGVRYDHVELKPEDRAARDFDAVNLSAAAIWRLTDGFDLRFGLDRSERAPTNEELFAGGTHVATQSIEIGDEALDTEKGVRAEIGAHWHTDRVDLKLALYQTKFTDFIYLTDTGVEEEGYPVRLWTQDDATFTGAEAEAKIQLADTASGAWDLRLFGDYVRAELDGSGTRTAAFEVPHGDHTHDYEVQIAQGGYLPRIAPMRVGADLGWSLGGWRASVGAVRYGKQDDVAQNEEASDGYTLVDAHVAYRWERTASSWEVFLDGSNLTDEEARPHTSLLRDYAPLPGRGVAFGLRAYF
ncbi:TonB-dependent receptor [Pseudoxanthomonas sp. SL93]|uniref:TonB-dependent receptor n=1 Tax=Pseudoxanthomonas sp. SL93 TaxID=2995142 RepID=UPI00226E26B9|nr:TonB-dependent receptor [Pseudoxanthomonas sp. SL93]WAC64768.1 TonB-dependent receptor [Pseudoxanthomonas sp. SL93]